jgi:hypothetical protein
VDDSGVIGYVAGREPRSGAGEGRRAVRKPYVCGRTSRRSARATCVLLLAAGCSLHSAGLLDEDDGSGAEIDWDAEGSVEIGADADRGADADDARSDEAGEEDVEPDVEPEDGVEPDEEEASDETAEEDDAGPEEVEEEVEAGICDPGGFDDHCSTNIIYRCRADGSGWTVTACDLGCADDGFAPHCFEMVPSNVADAALLTTGTAVLDAAGVRFVLFETDTGAIRAWDAAGVELTAIRAAGEGDVGGIVFTVQAQGGGAPDLGIWSLAAISVPAGVDVLGAGARAWVILSAGDVRIDGLLHASASPWFAIGAATIAHDNPGPGAAAGGGANTSGGGPGGGERGYEADWWVDSGGGGGALGGLGGAGGEVSGQVGGTGGAAHATAALVPLLGGSGGGGGADGDGGRGGHGGGVLEIASVTGIWIRAGGGITSGGGGGRGGYAADDGGGGGGGGSGGAILLEAPRIDIGGIVAVNGGGGGGGAQDGSTSGWSGGPGTLGVTSAAGGPGGGNGTAGGYGAAGAYVNGFPGENDGADKNGGGGGGGAGRIRLNALVRSIGGACSPGVETSLTTVGTLVLR